jgi:hypothetical protein
MNDKISTEKRIGEKAEAMGREFGELLAEIAAEAEARGYQRAIDTLRDEAARLDLGATRGWDLREAVRFLESRKAES